MIISHRHKFIFLHCRKAAGSAVTVSLARYLGPRDIQIGAYQDGIKEGVYPNLAAYLRLVTVRGGARFLQDFIRGHGFGAAFNRAVKASYRRFDREPAHPFASTVKAAFPREWESYFKFCIVRNPFERVVSDYFWSIRNRPNPPAFSEFVKAMNDRRTLNGIVSMRFDNWKMYTLDDKIAVDRVIRFERLEPELQEVCREIGLPWDGWLPKVKAETRGAVDYRELYTDQEKCLVETIFRKEIAHFGYRF